MSALPPHEAMAQKIMLRQAAFWEQRYPALKALNLNATPQNAELVCSIYGEHIKLMDEQAALLPLTNLYEHLVKSADGSGLGEGPRLELARLYIARGFVDRAIQLLNAGDTLFKEALAALTTHRERYKCDPAEVVRAGGSRGMGLVHYFSHHRELIQGKTILHIAPEPEFFEFIRVNQDKLECSYRAIDGTRAGKVENHDICAMDIDDESFDLILCHRVIEHIADETAALQDMHRVLRKGGCLNISAPEALYLEKTVDWVVPDPANHGHIRTYGMDFADIISQAGFEVQREEWLVTQPLESLIAAEAVPTVMYNALKR